MKNKKYLNKLYSLEDLIKDCNAVPKGNCVICGKITDVQLRNNNGVFEFVCPYPTYGGPSCKLKWHEKNG